MTLPTTILTERLTLPVDEAETALVASRRLDPLEARAGCALDALRIRRSASRFDPERRDSP